MCGTIARIASGDPILSLVVGPAWFWLRGRGVAPVFVSSVMQPGFARCSGHRDPASTGAGGQALFCTEALNRLTAVAK